MEVPHTKGEMSLAFTIVTEPKPEIHTAILIKVPEDKIKLGRETYGYLFAQRHNKGAMLAFEDSRVLPGLARCIVDQVAARVV